MLKTINNLTKNNLKMKTIIKLILLAGFFTGFTANAQQKTALHSNGVTTIFDGVNQFVNAYNAANSGDTIYLPGGTISAIPIINKKINVFGAGFHPDSTTATLQTSMANLTIQEFADSSYFSGINFTGNISTPYNQSVNYLTITRCSFLSITFDGNQANPCKHVTLKQNVIKGAIMLNNAQYSTISNNIIENLVQNGVYNAILNNIFLGLQYGSTFLSIANSMVANNVVFKTASSWNAINACDNTTFSNNIFTHTPAVGTNTFIGDFFNVDITTVFVNQTGNVFNTTNNYHLVNPATYQGNDATEIGIYGGLYPFKNGAVPLNPHIQFKNISTQTAPNGDLNIQLKVAAQDN